MLLWVVREEATNSQEKWKQHICAAPFLEESSTHLWTIYCLLLGLWSLPCCPSTCSKITFTLGLPESSSLKGTQKRRVKYIALVQEERGVFLGSRRQRGERGWGRRGGSGRSCWEKMCMCETNGGHRTLLDPQHSTNFLIPRGVGSLQATYSLVVALLYVHCSEAGANIWRHTLSFGPPLLPHRAQRVWEVSGICVKE